MKIKLDMVAQKIIDSGKGMDLLDLLADKLQTEQIKRRNYLLYLGLNRELTEDLRKELAGIVSRFSDSFTMMPAAGFFEASEEITIIIQIAAPHNKTAYDCAEAFRQKYDQEGVGVVVEVAGEYKRITKP